MPRAAEDVINQAIKENRVPEFILYEMLIAFVFVGIGIIVWSFASSHAWVAVAGAALDGLAWPAYKETKRVRQENLMLRLLEIPLSKARTADEAATMLTERFASLYKPEAERAVRRRGSGQ